MNLGWKCLDIIFVTGDAYIDSPYIGVALLGKLLLKQGYKVGIVSQPDLNSPEDILRMGSPKLFWAVTAGSIDSMVANYTPLLKKRKKDDYTPGGINNKRPDRATIRYVNLIKRFDTQKRLISIGGIEASLRRIAHYDYWSDTMRRSILFDSKADILMYGMSEKTILEFAECVKKEQDFKKIRGICYISKNPKKGFIDLPYYENVIQDKEELIKCMEIFYQNQDPLNANGLQQKTEKRYLIHNPPQYSPTQHELDSYYELDFEYDVHPLIRKKGDVKAIHTIKNSITINRGCFGECNFCAITLHQGSTVISRSQFSVIKEVKQIMKSSYFKGVINDLGGATANIYGYECNKKLNVGKCKDKRCIFPKVCKKMKVNHKKLIDLLEKIKKVKGVKKVFIQSGLRYDLIVEDSKYGYDYIKKIIKNHISGQLKIAPEHFDDEILKLMGKPNNNILKRFIEQFYKITKEVNKKQFLTYYIIVAHPGCNMEKGKELRKQLLKNIGTIPKQIQIFTPLPLTWSSIMYYTQKNPFNSQKIEVIKSLKEKAFQKNILMGKMY